MSGIVSALFLVKLAIVAMVSGLRRRVLLPMQLVRPATMSRVLTAVELTVFARLRDSLDVVLVATCPVC